MRGLTAGSGWTHLIPGMILAGAGAGLVNVPLASTAVGVVPPARAGMASGINSTLRSVGLAAGIAALGAIFTTQLRLSATAHLAGTVLASRAPALAHAISIGGVGQAVATVPQPLRGVLAAAARQAFVDELDLILLVGALAAGVATVTSLMLVRERDFVATHDDAEPLLDAAA